MDSLMIDVASGRIAFVVLSRGGSLGAGEQVYALPAQVLQKNMAGAELSLTTTVRPEDIRGAPRFDRDLWARYETRGNKSWLDELYRHYGLDRYPTRSSKNRKSREMLIISGNNLIGATVNSSPEGSTAEEQEQPLETGTKLGEIGDFTLQFPPSRVAFVVLSSGDVLGLGGKKYDLPIQKLKPEGRNQRFIARINPATMKQAPRYKSDQFTRADSGHGHRAWLSELYRHYGVGGVGGATPAKKQFSSPTGKRGDSMRHRTHPSDSPSGR